MTKEPEQFTVSAWPDGEPRYRKVGGFYEDTFLFRRTYATRASANRAVPNVRKMYPHAKIEVARYTLRSYGGWACLGGDDVVVYPAGR